MQTLKPVEMTRILHIVRHAPVVIEPDNPSAQWQLASSSDTLGRELATKLVAIGVRRVISFTAEPASCSRRIPIICSSLNRRFILKSSSSEELSCIMT